MEGTYYKEWSSALNREMEFKVYGKGGVPVLVFPVRGGRFYDWEDHGMLDASAHLLREGKIQIFCADRIKTEGLSPRRCAEMQEKYFNYITRELAERVRALNEKANKALKAAQPDVPKEEKVTAKSAEAAKAPKSAEKEAPVTIWCAGADAGACQAVSFRLRRPEIFCGAVALSGQYDIAGWMGGVQDDLALRNSPMSYLSAGLPGTKEKAALAQEGKLVLCAGQSSSESEYLSSARALNGALQTAQIPAHFEEWGADVTHDWSWWAKQWELFSGRLFY